MHHLSTFTINNPEIDFESAFMHLFGISDITLLHQYFQIPISAQSSNDSSTLLHKVFYSNFTYLFQPLYLSFLSELSLIVGEPFYYQCIPNVRFGLPGHSWLSRFHTDLEYKHPSCEYNVNIAVTDSYGSAALQIQEHPDSDTYISLTQNKRHFTFIDHINCRHGSVVNNENYTLVSLDFRFILKKDLYKLTLDSSDSSLTQHKRFVPGDYFSSTPYSA